MDAAIATLNITAALLIWGAVYVDNRWKKRNNAELREVYKGQAKERAEQWEAEAARREADATRWEAMVADIKAFNAKDPA